MKEELERARVAEEINKIQAELKKLEKGKLLEKGYIETDFYCGLTLDEALPYLMRHLDHYKKHRSQIPELVVKYMKLCKETPGFKSDNDQVLERDIKSLLSSVYETDLFPDFLRIIQILYTFKDDKKRALSEARTVFDNQGHSGITTSITANWVRWYSEYFGEDFFYMIYPELKERDE